MSRLVDMVVLDLVLRPCRHLLDLVTLCCSRRARPCPSTLRASLPVTRVDPAVDPVMSANSADVFLQGRHERAMIRLCALLWILKLEEDRLLQGQDPHPCSPPVPRANSTTNTSPGGQGSCCCCCRCDECEHLAASARMCSGTNDALVCGRRKLICQVNVNFPPSTTTTHTPLFSLSLLCFSSWNGTFASFSNPCECRCSWCVSEMY